MVRMCSIVNIKLAWAALTQITSLHGFCTFVSCHGMNHYSTIQRNCPVESDEHPLSETWLQIFLLKSHGLEFPP